MVGEAPLPKRGDVYLIALDPTLGREIKKTRPCVVVSPDELNGHLSTFIVAPLRRRTAISCSTRSGRLTDGDWSAERVGSRVPLWTRHSRGSGRCLLRSSVVREALRRQLALAQFEDLRERMVPFAEAAG